MSKRDCKPAGPVPYIRAAEANNQTSTVAFLSELFDNSIDAGARRIVAAIKGEKRGSGHGAFCIADDGYGVENIETLLSVGETTKDGVDSIGRYGVGAKDCIYSVGGLSSTLDIDSAAKGSSWTASLTWRTQEDWQFDQIDCDAEDMDLHGTTGLRLQLSKCHRRMPAGSEMHRHLQRSYWPWLRIAGNVIELNGEAVTAPAAPATDGRLAGTFNLDGGRSFSIAGGSLRGDSDLAGVTVFCGNRAIAVASAIGLGDFSRSGLFALVTLSGPWVMERNKTGLIEEHQEELCDSLERIIAPVAKQASERMREMEAGDLLDSLNDRFAGVQEATGIATRPNKGGGSGTVEVRGTGRETREATKVGGLGDVRERDGKKAKRRKPYRIDIVVGNNEKSVGSVDVVSRRIALFKNNASVSQMLAEIDERGLMLTAAALLCDARRDAGRLPFPDVFASTIGAILAGEARSVA